MGNFLIILFIGTIVLGILFYVKQFVCFILMPVNFAVISVINFITKPFSWLYGKILDLLEKIKSKLLGNRLYSYYLEAWGGTEYIISAAVAALIAIAIIVYICLTKEDALYFIEETIILKLPSMFIIDLAVNGSDFFGLESLIQMTIFSALSISVMRKIEALEWYVKTTYEIVYTVFFSLAVYIFPQSLYRLPITVFNGITTIPKSDLFDGPFALFLFIFVIISLILVGYIIVGVFALAIKELVASITFAIFPFAVSAIFFLLIEELAPQGFLRTLLFYIVTIVANILLGRFRIEYENEYEEKRAYKKQQRLARKQYRRLAR